MHLPHLLARVFNTPLMINQAKLHTILSVLGPRFAHGEKMLVPVPAQQRPGVKGFTRMGNVAVVNISGTLVHKASGMEAESGLISYAQVEEILMDAATDPSISGILLDVNSPGGEVAGCFTLADMIYALRGVKPVWAVANECACSAAYALASSAEKVFTTITAEVGSIGVIAAHLDQSGFDEAEGLKYTFVFSGAHKNDFNAHAPLSEAAQARMQESIAKTYDLFVELVARNRGLPRAAIISTEALTYTGGDAVAIGLADGVSHFRAVLEMFTATLDGNQPAPAGHSSSATHQQTEKKKMEVNTTPVAEATTQTAAAPQIDAAAIANEAAAKERTRIAAIHKAGSAMRIPAAKVQAAVDGGVSAEAALAGFVEYAAGQQAAASINGVSGTTESAPESPAELSLEEQCAKEWQKSAALRAEFAPCGGMAAYVAFAKNQHRANIKG